MGFRVEGPYAWTIGSTLDVGALTIINIMVLSSQKSSGILHATRVSQSDTRFDFNSMENPQRVQTLNYQGITSPKAVVAMIFKPQFLDDEVFGPSGLS